MRRGRAGRALEGVGVSWFGIFGITVAAVVVGVALGVAVLVKVLQRKNGE